MELKCIRQACLADSAEIARLADQLGYAATSDQVAARLPTLLGSDSHSVVVAEATAPELLGWILVERRLSLAAPQRTEIAALVVSSSARQLGIGKKLVAASEEWTTQQGLTSICVRSNAVRNDAHPFYQHLGYSRVKTQHVYEKII